MQKLITAGAAVLLVGIGAFSASHSDAQRVTTQGEIIEKDGKVRVVETKIEPKIGYWLEEDVTYSPIQFMPHGQPGTWQIVTHDDVILLLNSATGETFHLDDNDDGMFWKPIRRPGAERREMPRRPDAPRMPRDREDMNPERLAERIEEMRKRAEKARGESLEKLERTIEELERLRKESKPRGDKERDRPEKRDRKDRSGDLEDVIRELEEKIVDLKERWEESDSVREREKLEKAVKELKEEAERVRKELKELRR